MLLAIIWGSAATAADFDPCLPSYADTVAERMSTTARPRARVCKEFML